MRAEFPRDIAALDDVFRFVAEFFAAEELDQTDRFPVDFAIEEVFTNYVKYNRDGAGEIEIGLRLDDGQLVMELMDFDSDRFDLNADAPIVDTSEPLEAREAGGLGVHLVKRLMDRVEYRHEQRTSTITLYKRLGESHARD